MLLALQLLNLLESGGASDTTPDAFAGETRTQQALNATVTFTTFIPTGYTSADIDVSGSSGLYSINGGSYVDTAGTVTAGDTVTVRNTASGTNSTAVVTVLTIGGVSAEFTSVTLDAAGQGSMTAFRRRGRR